MKNQQITLAARPVGEVKLTDFMLSDSDLPAVGDGQVLVQIHHLAVEPAMKGWIEARVDYVKPVEIGDVMRGTGSGVVMESKNADFPVGTVVSGSFGWQRYCVTDGRAEAMRKVPEGIEQTAALNVLGITGLTAYFGMGEIGKPKAGETVLVSGAAGATGSIAGQLARIAGCRVVGIAGGQEKCDWLVKELGFDAAVDYKGGNTAKDIKAACPDGVHVYYDNVGGEILDMALARLAMNARVVLCGGISRYNQTGHIPGPSNYFNLVYRRARMEGFILVDYVDRFAEASAALAKHLQSGDIKHHETILEGFENTPQALINLFTGANLGKQLVAVEHD